MKRVLVWGTGDFAQQFISDGCEGDIIGFIETIKTKDTFMQKPVYSSHEIPENGYDYIVIANSYGTEIYSLCIKQDIDISKLIFLYGIERRVGCIEEAVLKEILSEINYDNYCIRFRLKPKPKQQPRQQEHDFIYEDAEKYQEMNKRPNFAIQERYMFPIATDKYEKAGNIDDYFQQDLWAARLIYKSGVKRQVDIGSRLDGFIAHLLAMDIDVTVIDVREFPGEVEKLHTIVDDATYLKQIPDESVESMSALCSLEHFGLGRYGDPIDPEACFKCFDAIQRKLKKGGKLYISVPVGKERVEFNAHRVFYASTIIECFSDMKLEEFSCTTDGVLESHIEDIHKYDNEEYNLPCGLFYFIKK